MQPSKQVLFIKNNLQDLKENEKGSCNCKEWFSKLKNKTIKLQILKPSERIYNPFTDPLQHEKGEKLDFKKNEKEIRLQKGRLQSKAGRSWFKSF